MTIQVSQVLLCIVSFLAGIGAGVMWCWLVVETSRRRNHMQVQHVGGGGHGQRDGWTSG